MGNCEHEHYVTVLGIEQLQVVVEWEGAREGDQKWVVNENHLISILQCFYFGPHFHTGFLESLKCPAPENPS